MLPADTLVIGYGNPGRGDDGLGPRFIEALEQESLHGLHLESNYQLAVEDSLLVAQASCVIFVDASCTARSPFEFCPLKPASDFSVESHHLTPASLLSLTQTLQGSHPPAYLLAIRGYAYDAFTESLSQKADANLREALRFFHSLHTNPDRVCHA